MSLQEIRQNHKTHLLIDVKEVKSPIMLTRLREIVEKGSSAPRLNGALNILVTDICLAMMDTEVCSVYWPIMIDVVTTYGDPGLKNHAVAPYASRLMKDRQPGWWRGGN